MKKCTIKPKKMEADKKKNVRTNLIMKGPNFYFILTKI